MQTSPCGGRWREREAGQSDGSAAAPLCWCDLPLHFKSSQEAGTGRHQAGQGMHHKAAWVAAGRGGWRAGAPAGGTSSPAVRGLLLLLAAPGQDGQEEVTLRAKTTTQAAATFPSQDRSPFVSEHTGVCTFQGQRPFTSVAPAPVSGEPPPRRQSRDPPKSVSFRQSPFQRQLWTNEPGRCPSCWPGVRGARQLLCLENSFLSGLASAT